MKKILALIALVLIVSVISGCATKVAQPGKAAVVQGESEISTDVSEIDTLDTELEDTEAEAELDAIGDAFSDW